MLSDYVQISRHYQRSIRIDVDLGRPDSLEGYICHGTALSVLASMSKQLVDSNQRAFTWTGPFGGGKSSLAVALASALSPDSKLRAKARSILPLEKLPSFEKAFPTRRGWLTLPVVGKRGSVVQELIKALRVARGQAMDPRKTYPGSATSIISDLCEEAENKKHDGVFVMLDEMGKFLEAAALEAGNDVYFFQELAEAAARTAGKLVIVGILHQSFGQYASRLGNDTRSDWSKVQGRFSDISLVAASDEVVELVGRAIASPGQPSWMVSASTVVADSIRSRRPGVGTDFEKSLVTCWPLHPAMAALLGPISKRQFGQNERSTFGFLGSVEPHGFRTYLEETPRNKATWYRPSDYWDYLRANLEPAILASPDGHRWAQAVEAVERAEAKSGGNELHVKLIKNIAVIDMFRNGSGLAAEEQVLKSFFYMNSMEEIKEALDQLKKWRVILFKLHTGAWSVFEGSDFDIDAAVAKTRAAMHGVDFNLLTSLSNMYPVIAKRHYHAKGTMRWMDMELCRLEDVHRIAADFKPRKGEFGAFLLALPGKALSGKAALKICREASRTKPWPIAISVPGNHSKIEDLGAELLALQQVELLHELAGDPVARREVHARLSSVRANLEEQLRSAVANAKWLVGDDESYSGMKLSPLASSLADDLYDMGPALWSELVNRDNLSSNSVKARRDLLHRMLDHEGEQDLGYEGYPADRGLYETLLRATGLHREDEEGYWRFLPPNEEFAGTFTDLWEATSKLFGNGKRVEATAIQQMWASPPFGLRKGAAPVIMTAFLLAHKGNVAVYKDGVFIPKLTDADIDEFLQDDRRFSMRWVVINEDRKRVLSGISKILAEAGAVSSARDPLEAARGLVALVMDLPSWSKRTHSISDKARAIRDTLLKASDPHKVLFVDLTAILDTENGDAYVKALRGPVIEIAHAYERLLRKVEMSMLEALDAPHDDLDRLRVRAEAIAGMTGDLRQDAFTARLATHDHSRESIEGILSLAANKPPRDWNDRDVDAALLEIARFALRFRQVEAFASVKGRAPTSEAFAVVIGTGAQTKTVTREFSLSDRHRAKVDSMANAIVDQLYGAGMDVDALLAVLAHAGMRLTSEDSKKKKEKAHG
jgi:hypothetical protein